jgi:hypothetical protein
MVDPLAVFAVALSQFDGPCDEFICQRSLTCQCRVPLAPQRDDNGIRVGCCIVWWRGHPFPLASVNRRYDANAAKAENAKASVYSSSRTSRRNCCQNSGLDIRLVIHNQHPYRHRTGPTIWCHAWAFGFVAMFSPGWPDARHADRQRVGKPSQGINPNLLTTSVTGRGQPPGLNGAFCKPWRATTSSTPQSLMIAGQSAGDP